MLLFLALSLTLLSGLASVTHQDHVAWRATDTVSLYVGIPTLNDPRLLAD